MTNSPGAPHDLWAGPDAAAPVLVLLHPFPFDRRFWAKVAPALAARFRVVAPDLRGFGAAAALAAGDGAPPEPGGYSIADLADDVAGLLDALAVDRAIVGGLSMGGYVALAFAARHARRLRGLLLADTKAGPDAPEARAARGDAIELVRAQGVDAYVERQMPRLLAASAATAVREEVRALARQHPAAVVAGLAALRDRPDRRAELPAIRCPTQILVGEHDILTPPAEAQAMAAAIAGARIEVLPDAGHLPPLETPAAFARAVLAAPWA